MLGVVKDQNLLIKEEILNLIIHFYSTEEYIPYNYEKILNEISFLTQNSNTKIKLKAIECLV